MAIETALLHGPFVILSLIVKLERDDGQRLVLAIDAHEVEERFGRLQRRLSDK